VLKWTYSDKLKVLVQLVNLYIHTQADDSDTVLENTCRLMKLHN